jgi:hypothetical protein
VSTEAEAPWRAFHVLLNVARGHALVAGRRHLTEADLPVVARIAISSMPTDMRKVLSALVHDGDGMVSVEDARAVSGVSHPETARRMLRAACDRGLGWFDESGPGTRAIFCFRPEWAWCGSPTFRDLLAGEPVTNPGV